MSAIRRDDKGAPVYLLQGLLNGLGHELEVDGKFGESTEATVKSFQQENDLSADGAVGEKTSMALAQALNING